jgi:taurine dioxygenase
MKATREMSSTPISPVLGVELHGIDIGAGIDDAQMRFLLDELHRHSVVLLRGQRITPDQQVAFSKRLGPPLRVSLFSKHRPDGVDELTVVSNIVRDGKPIGVMDAGALWHTDGSYLQNPDMYTVLYALEIPHRDGEPLGDTVFTSTFAAYDALPAQMQSRLDGLRAVNSLAHHMALRRKTNLRAAPVTGNVEDVAPDVEHPVVRSHPETGRKGLFVSEGHTRCIVGMDAAQSEALLQSLYEHLRKPEFLYHHKWRVGDVLVWDNCSTQHLATADYGTIPRLLHRAGISGPRPV